MNEIQEANVGDIREVVRQRYGALAEGAGGGCCGVETAEPKGEAASAAGCGCGCSPTETLQQIGYTADQRAAIPEGANLGLGCGNPLAGAGVKAGETVLDLGSGAGIDVFLAAREVGPAGHAIGVDMTTSMVERARANAKKGGYANVEFRLGEIEHLPAADASVDLIISNCVVNLSPDKAQVFREAHRVLRPGGRMVVSDLVLERPLPAKIRESVEAYVGCIAGASLKGDYVRLIREAGFRDVEVLGEGNYSAGASAADGDSESEEAFRAVRSVQVRAWK
jgi:arsenite methyltransferase